MSWQQIPLTSAPNQTMSVTLTIDNRNRDFILKFSWNQAGQYWVMRISEGNNILADSIPLLSGEEPVDNLLAQYAYMGIGSAFIINVSGINSDKPDDTNLGSDFILVWGDTPSA